MTTSVHIDIQQLKMISVYNLIKFMHDIILTVLLIKCIFYKSYIKVGNNSLKQKSFIFFMGSNDNFYFYFAKYKN